MKVKGVPKLRGLRRGGRPASATRGRTFLAAVGFLGIATAIAMLAIGYNSPNSIPGRSYYNLQAEFTNADNLTKSYQVRIGGRLVGQVLDPHVENGKAVVKLQLTPDIKPLKSDTTLRVRPRSPVGVRFVELVPGTKGTDLPENGRIPASQTSAAVQLDEVFDTLDTDRRAKAQVFLNELGNGFLDRGEDLNESIRRAPQALSNLNQVASEVIARRGAPGRFIASSQAAANAAEPVREDIRTGFDPEARTLRIFSDEQDALRRALDTAPPALRSMQGDLARTTPLLRELTRFAKAARPALTTSRATLTDTSALLREAAPGLRATRDALRTAEKAVPPTLSLLRTLKPVLPDIDLALDDSNPLLLQLSPRDCDLDRFFDDWASTLAFGDGFSNVLRFNVTGTAETLGVQSSRNLPGMFQKGYPDPCEVGTQRVGGAR